MSVTTSAPSPEVLGIMNLGRVRSRLALVKQPLLSDIAHPFHDSIFIQKVYLALCRVYVHVHRLGVNL